MYRIRCGNEPCLCQMSCSRFLMTPVAQATDPTVSADGQKPNTDGVVEMDEAGIAHLLPKVMVPYLTRPGETPRKVQISRYAPGLL